MNKQNDWKEMLEYIQSKNNEEYKRTNEYELKKQRWEQTDEMLTTNLTSVQKEMIEEVLFELGLSEERERERIYQEGISDCIWILKHLGVLA